MASSRSNVSTESRSDPDGLYFAALNAATADAAADLATQYRAAATNVWRHERAYVAVSVALRYRALGQLDEAQVWCLRALSDGPRVDAMVLLGQLAEAVCDWEAAHAWLEAACAIPYEPEGAAFDELLRGRTSHRDELRQQQQHLMMLAPVHQLRQRRLRWHAQPRERVLVIQTAPRPDERLWQRTVRSMEAAGVDAWRGPRYIFGDGIDRRLPAWTSNTTKTSIGALHTFGRILEHVAAQHPGKDLLLLEDDIVFARNALTCIARADIDPDLCAVSWFWPQLAPFEGGMVIAPAAAFLFNQCVLLPARTVAALVAAHPRWPKRHSGGDTVLPAIMPAAEYGIVMPNLVQHVGDRVSAIAGTKDLGARVSLSFPGEDFDALTLINRPL